MNEQTTEQAINQNTNSTDEILPAHELFKLLFEALTGKINNPVKKATSDGIPFVIAKTMIDGKTTREDVKSIEHLLPNPIRKTASVDFKRPESFMLYVNAHKIDTHTAIYIHERDENLSVKAVIDDNQVSANGIAAWGSHLATYTPEVSREWSTWMMANGSPSRQAQFAHFIESNLLDIAQPAGADLLEIVKTLEAKKSVKFKTGVRLDNGDTVFQYEETTDSKAGEKGQFQIPQTITLAIPVFKGGDPYQLEANFRYRIEDGELTMWYELVRPHKIVEHAMETIVKQFIDGIPNVPFYYGWK